MASEFQSSFIPKNPTSQDVFVKKKAGFLGVIVVSLFIFSIIASVGVYFYKGIIKGDIESLQSQLADAEKNIDKKTIKELGVFSKKLKLIQSLVNKHQVISGFLVSLSSSTVSQVSLTGLIFNTTPQGELGVAMEGKASSYASIALQEKIFSQNQYWTKIKFSELTPSEGGLVTFKAQATVDPQIVVYSPLIVETAEPENSLPAEDLSSGIPNLDNLDDIDFSGLENL